MADIVFKILLCFFFTSLCWGQRIYVETGLSSASFVDFENNEGINSLIEEPTKPRKIGLGAGVLFPYFKNLLWLDTGLQYNNYQINTNVLNFGANIPLRYDFSFLTLKAGAIFKLVDFSKLRARVHAHLSQGWLTKGERSYQDITTDLVEDNQFHDSLFNYHFGAGLEIALHPKVSVYLSQDFKGSFKKVEKEADAYGIKASALIIGLLFNLPTKGRRGRSYYRY